jgi:DNA-binding transcriptional ArsR family regulator
LRDFEGTDLGLRFENGWKLEGSAKEVMLAEEQRKIVEAIRSLESMGEKATIKAIAEIVNKSQGAIRFALFDLVQKGVVFRKERGVYSLLDTKTTNITNITNKPNIPNIPNIPAPSPLVSPEDPFVRFVRSEVKNDLTIPDQNLQGLQGNVRFVRNVSNVIKSDLSPSTPTPTSEPTPNPNPDPDLPFDAKPKGTPDRTSEPSEEEVIYILMPENEKCPICGWDVWATDRATYKMGRGGARCLKCGHVSWFKFFGADGKPKGQIVGKEDLPFLLYDPVSIEAKENLKLFGEAILKLFGEIRNEGNGFSKADNLKKWLEKNLGRG